MGSGLSTQAPTVTVSIDAYIVELVDLTYIGDLGRARFLKATKAQHRDGPVVVKVFLKPSIPIDLTQIKEVLTRYQTDLKGIPNALPISRIIETDRAAYVVRQHIQHNLYDRISTRPFLEPIEKLWITFQLIRALGDIHSRHIYHGDLKTENILLSSWNWIYLSDWAPFKPVCLPESDSAQFLFYFDTSQRRTCYVAPERFSNDCDQLTPQMDIYSAGCVIAEMYMDGEPLLTFADLFRYKSHAFTPQLSKIEDDNVRDLVQSMISLDPSDRHEASIYLQEFRQRLFPEYFWSLYDDLKDFTFTSEENSDNRVEHVWSNFDKYLHWLDFIPVSTDVQPETLLPVVLSIGNLRWIPRAARSPLDLCEGALIPLTFICASIFNTSTESCRVHALKLLLALSELVSNEVKLDRCLPYFCSLLKDKSLFVQKTSIRYIAHLFTMITELSSLNLKVFSEYIFPRLNAVLHSTDPCVTATYAACLPSLTGSARSLLKDFRTVDFQIEDHVRMLLTSESPLVRQTLLQNISSLCLLLGSRRTNDLVLSHAITYLNDRDLRVSIQFFKTVAQIGPLVGIASLEQFLLPLMLQSLVDYREELVSAVLSTFASLTSLGLIRLKPLTDLLTYCAKFFIHPNPYIRTNVFHLFCESAKWMEPAQVFCLLRPIVKPLLQVEITDFTSLNQYVSFVKPHMSAAAYSLAMNWAAKARKSSFWSLESTSVVSLASMMNPSTFFGRRFTQFTSSRKTRHSTASHLFETTSQSSQKFSSEDRRWLARLNDINFGMDQMWQLNIFRDYLWQVASNKQLDILFEPSTKIEPLPQSWKLGAKTVGLEKFLAAHKTELSKNSRNLSVATTGHIKHIETKLTPINTPIGKLIASIDAHDEAITAVVAFPNSTLFITGSDDAILKCWDVRNFSKGIRQPVSSFRLRSRIKSLRFFNSSNILVVGTVDGDLSFLHVRYTKNEKDAAQVTMKVMHCQNLCNAALIALYDDGQFLFVLTTDSAIYKFSLESLTATVMKNPVAHGIPKCWVFGPSHDWLVIGTSHGILDLWDLRFGLLVQTWGIGDLCPITALHLHPHTSGRWIVVAGGYRQPVVTTWDTQMVECREVLTTCEVENSLESCIFEPIKELQTKFANWDISSTFEWPNKRTETLVCCQDSTGHNIVLTGGQDRILRWWNLDVPQNCRVISGMDTGVATVTYNKHIHSGIQHLRENCSKRRQHDREVKTALLFNELCDIGCNHQGSITAIALLPLSRTTIISADQIGHIKIYV